MAQREQAPVRHRQSARKGHPSVERVVGGKVTHPSASRKKIMVQVPNGAFPGMADGTVDIVVGTHALLAKGIRFQNLGLLIIDEVHELKNPHTLATMLAAAAGLHALADRVLRKLRQGSMRGHRRACATMIELRDALLRPDVILAHLTANLADAEMAALQAALKTLNDVYPNQMVQATDPKCAPKLTRSLALTLTKP